MFIYIYMYMCVYVTYNLLTQLVIAWQKALLDFKNVS